MNSLNWWSDYNKRIISLQILALIVLTFLAFSNTLFNDFTWDDQSFVVSSPYIKDAKYIPDYFTKDNWMLSNQKYSSGYLRPIFLLSLYVDHFFWGLNPFGFHLSNIILHILCVLLLYLFALKIFKNRFFAFLASVFFALHPAHVESVASIACRVDIQATLFGLLSLLVFTHFNDRRGLGKAFRSFASSLFFLFAILSKEVAMLIPGLILLYELYFNPQISFKKPFQILRRYLNLIITFILYLSYRFIIFPHGHLANKASYNFIRFQESFCANSLAVIQTLSGYIKLMIFPTNLNNAYALERQASIFHLNTLIILCAALIFIWSLRKNKIIAFGIAWFFFSLLLYANIIPIAWIFAERELYLASIGFCIALAGASKYLYENKIKHFMSFLSPRLLNIYLVLLCALYFQSAYLRIFDWRSELSLWKSASLASPKSVGAKINLGIAYTKLGKLKKAEEIFKDALKLDKENHKVYYNLGVVYSKMQQHEKALKEFKNSLDYTTGEAGIYNGIGREYIFLNKPQEAVQAFQDALKIDPEHINSLMDLGSTLMNIKDFDGSLKYLNQLIEIDQTFAKAYYTKGLVLLMQKKKVQADKSFRKAIQLDPSFKDIVPKIDE